MTDFQTVIITTIAIVCSMVVAAIVIGLIIHCGFLKERKKLIAEAKEKYPELFDTFEKSSALHTAHNEENTE